jgi:hypothetical protein
MIISRIFIGILVFILIGLVCILASKFYFLIRGSLQKKTTIAFLHPNIDQFGGGEKVFWHMFDVVAGLVKNNSKVEVVVYSFPSSKENLQTFDGLLKYATVCRKLKMLYFFFYFRKLGELLLIILPIIRMLVLLLFLF